MVVDNINNFLDYRKSLLREIEMSYQKFTEAILNFNDEDSSKPINKEALNTFPLMQWVNLNPKVKVRKRNNRFGDHLCFDTKMGIGGRFGEHFHEDIIESTEVIYGQMLDTYTGTVYRDGDVAHYEKGEKHTPIAQEETLLHVLFKP